MLVRNVAADLPMHSSWLGHSLLFDFAFWVCWIPFGRGIVLCIAAWHWEEGPVVGNVLRHGGLSFGVQSTIKGVITGRFVPGF